MPTFPPLRLSTLDGATNGICLKLILPNGTLTKNGTTWTYTPAGGVGSGTVTNNGGNLTANAIVLGAGVADTKVVAGIVTDGASKVILGVAGSSVGSIDFKNATSGAINLAPPTGALGTSNLKLPIASDTLVGKATTDIFTNKTYDTVGTGNVFKINGAQVSSIGGNLSIAGGVLDATGGGGVTGSGTTGTVPIWSGSTALGDSHITDGSTFTVNMAGVGDIALLSSGLDANVDGAPITIRDTGHGNVLNSGVTLPARWGGLGLDASAQTGILLDTAGTFSFLASSGTGNVARVAGAALTGLTGLGIRSTGAAFDLTLASSEVLTAGRTLSVVLGDAARTLTVGASASVSGSNTGDQDLSSYAPLASPVFSGVVGVGLSATTPPTSFVVADSSTASPRGIMSWQANTGTDGARLGFRKNRGTFASPTTIVSGDTIGRLVAWPYDGTGWLEMGSIAFESTGTIATNRTPTQIVFKTATDAAPSVLTTALTLGADQKAVFAGTVSTPGIVTASGALTITPASNANVAIVSTGVVTTTGSFAQAGGTTASSYVRSNSGNLASSTNLNPGFLVFGDSSTNAYGMDIGANSGTFGLRLFSPNNIDFSLSPSGSAITAQSSLTPSFRVVVAGSTSATILPSGGVYGLSSNTNPAGAGNDTGLSRISAGVWGVGTGAQGSFAGTIKTTGLLVQGVPTFNGTNTTGAGTALLGTNSPAITNSAPYTWVQITTSDGSTGYIPVWK